MMTQTYHSRRKLLNVYWESIPDDKKGIDYSTYSSEQFERILTWAMDKQVDSREKLLIKNGLTFKQNKIFKGEVDTGVTIDFDTINNESLLTIIKLINND